MQALLEYEKYKGENGEIQLPASSLPHTSGEKEVGFCFFIFYNSVKGGRILFKGKVL